MSSHPLSEAAARRCETATTPPSECRCRCKGLYHGGQRPDAAMLIDGDPHQFIPASERKQRKRRKHSTSASGASSSPMTAERAARSIASLERAISDPAEAEHVREAARAYIAKLREQFSELAIEARP